MHPRLIITAIVLTLLPVLASAMDFDFPTTTRYADALRQAQSEKKAVLVAFLSSSCSHCQAMKKNVFAKEAFIAFAKANLVVVAFDYATINDMTSDERAVLSKLEDKFQVEGFPTVILLTPNEQVLLQSSGYAGSSAEDVVTLFKDKLRSAPKKM